MKSTQPWGLRPRYVVSACLCGQAVRYDGGSCPDPEWIKRAKQGEALPVCPECLGGLPTPRSPAECQPDGRILNQDGEDCTEAYRRGAELVLELCRLWGITRAVLKENSPSCGSCRIYDGSFSGRKIPGEGVTARLLREHGIAVYSEGSWPGDEAIQDAEREDD